MQLRELCDRPLKLSDSRDFQGSIALPYPLVLSFSLLDGMIWKPSPSHPNVDRFARSE